VQLANGRVYDPAPDLARQQHALLGLTEGGIAGPVRPSWTRIRIQASWRRTSSGA
jgi:hypothetical protein